MPPGNALDRLASAASLPTVPLLRAPESWPPWLVGASAMVLLALLDLAGAVAAKKWSRSGGALPLTAGVVAFLTLFWVYASALQYAELALVTLGWIVALQVGMLIVDHVRYGVQLPTGSWVAVGMILAAQAYLLLAPMTTPPVLTPRLPPSRPRTRRSVDAVDVWSSMRQVRRR